MLATSIVATGYPWLSNPALAEGSWPMQPGQLGTVKRWDQRLGLPCAHPGDCLNFGEPHMISLGLAGMAMPCPSSMSNPGGAPRYFHHSITNSQRQAFKNIIQLTFRHERRHYPTKISKQHLKTQNHHSNTGSAIVTCQFNHSKPSLQNNLISTIAKLSWRSYSLDTSLLKRIFNT